MPQTNMANCVWNRLLTRVANRYGEHVEQQRWFSRALVLSVRRTEVICRSTCRYNEHVEQQCCYFSSKALPSQAVCSSQALPSLAREFCYFSSTFFYFLFLVRRTEVICRSTCRYGEHVEQQIIYTGCKPAPANKLRVH